jgi:hypothetical protein
MTSCPLTGYLWSKNAGWIRFSGNIGAPDVTYDKSTYTLLGAAWNNQIGWVDMTGIHALVGAVGFTPPGWVILPDGDYAMTTTGSTVFPLSIPPAILSILLANGTTQIEVCTISICQTVPMDTFGNFSGLDFSIANDYTYTITDAFNSKTTGTIHIYAGPIVSAGGPVLWGTWWIWRLKSYCISHSDMFCSDGSSLKTTYVTGDLKNGEIVWDKYANNNDTYKAQLALRDAYGNPVKSVTWVKEVKYRVNLTSDLDFKNVANYQYGYSPAWLGDAFSISTGPTISPPYSFIWNYSPIGDTFSLGSYAPTTVGNTTIPSNNNLKIDTVTLSVNPLWAYSALNIGWWSSDLSSMIKKESLPFKPLVIVDDFQGLSDVQLGRLVSFTGMVTKLWWTQTDIHVIHALSIGDGLSPTLASFQDFRDINPSQDCKASTDNPPGYNWYCARLSASIASPATVISYPLSAANDIHTFTLMPRRIEQVSLEQPSFYDSIISYKLWGKEIVYPSFSLRTLDAKVFANAVRIIWPKSGLTIFQSIKTLDQSTIANIPRIDIINTIRKNIWVLVRNVTFDVNAKYESTSTRVYKKNISLDPQIDLVSGIRTIVAYGDITIIGDLSKSDTISPLAIIALRDDAGRGWNIYIKSTVKRLDASLVAESTLFSWEMWPPPLYYATSSNAVTNLVNQLYVYGTIISLNTIGWAALPAAGKCPSNTTSICNNENALIYDFEHMRYYRGGLTESAPLARWASQLRPDEKKSSFIIEYDPALISNPPPWLYP